MRPVLVALTVVLVAMLVVPDIASAAPTPGLDEARQAATDATRKLSALESELGDLEGEVDRLAADRERAESELAGLRDRVRDLAIRRYTDVGQEPSPFQAADSNAHQRASVMLRIVTQADTDAIDAYRATKERLEQASADLDERRADQEARLRDLRDARSRLDAELVRLEAVEAERLAVERAAAEQTAREAADAAARDRAAEAAAQLAARQDAAKAGKQGTGTDGGRPSGQSPPPPPQNPPPPIAGGSWVCPVQGPKSFVNSWGASRPGGNSHQGVDIMSPRGTPVVTPVAGTVTLKSGGIGGLNFRLDGDDGNWYYGAHMDEFAGPSGYLPAGTLVGYVGDTGDAKGTGTHLHFEIHLGGYRNAVNPYPTVARHC